MPIYGGSGSTIYRVALHPVAAFSVMYDVDGYHADIADSADVIHESTVIGIVQSGVTAGEVVPLTRQGVFEDPTLSIPLGRLFLGTAGAIVNTPPAHGIMVQVGFAASRNNAVIDVQPAIRRL